MLRQDKATTERHARILRELVKRPENKTCADCKRQDARWASWNIGVFICIRCSGIHRSIGTHITKVKSVDLDTWTPEQMESIQKWGNHRANLYWEARLRPGHVPPESKIDSFIRSKYETRRWAREGPPPDDPLVLESAEVISATNGAPAASPPVSELSSPPITSPPMTSRQPQTHRLLSTTVAGRASTVQPAPVQGVKQAKALELPKPVPEPQNDLFSLDFHAPTSPISQQPEAPKKDVKNDILSLYSKSSSAAATVPGNAAFGQLGASPWSQPQAQSNNQSQSISMMGTAGTAMWGAQSGWTPPVPPTQSDLWGGFQNASAPSVPGTTQQSSNQSIFETQSVWGAPPAAGVSSVGEANDLFGSSTTNKPTALSTSQKKDDVFGDLWGDFK